MSKSCKECGHQLDDNAQECPFCGCPVEKESTSAVVDTDLLNEGKNTEAESTIRDYTYSGAYPFNIPGLQSAAERAEKASF